MRAIVVIILFIILKHMFWCSKDLYIQHMFLLRNNKIIFDLTLLPGGVLGTCAQKKCYANK